MKEIEVSKEASELMTGLIEVVKAVKEANKDGFQMGQDLPAIVSTLFGQMAALQGLDKIGDEIKENPVAFGSAMAIGIAGIYGVLKKEEPALPEAQAQA